MVSKKGWVKIHRDLQDHWLWEGKHSKQSAWIDLIMLVNHEPRKINIGNQIIEIKAGQTWTSICKLAERWQWSRDKTANFLNLLQSDGMIYKDSGTQGTLLTIVNYCDYQDNDSKSPTSNSTANSATNSATPTASNRHQTRHKQELKNDKELIKNEKKRASPKPTWGEWQ